MDENEAKQVLFKFADIADSLGITYFLASGTCLGVVRDNSFIPGDNDVDVGVLCDKNKLLKLYNELVKVFRFGSAWYDPNKNRKVIYVLHFWQNRVLLDIFCTFPEEEKKFFNSFDEVTFLGRKFNVPHPVDSYLTSHYGNWRVKSPKAVPFLRGIKVELEEVEL